MTAWLGFSTGTGAGTSTGSVVAAKLSFIPSVAELFSRSKGLLETGVLKDKCVGIVGLGSGGSPVALVSALLCSVSVGSVPVSCRSLLVRASAALCSCASSRLLFNAVSASLTVRCASQRL